MQHLIMRNGPAGVIAAETLRSRGCRDLRHGREAEDRLPAGPASALRTRRDHYRPEHEDQFARRFRRRRLHGGHRLLDGKTHSQCDSARRWPGARHIARFPESEDKDKDTFKHLRLEFNGNHLIGATSVLDRARRRAAMADPSKTKLSPQRKAMLLKNPHNFVDPYLACGQAVP